MFTIIRFFACFLSVMADVDADAAFFSFLSLCLFGLFLRSVSCSQPARGSRCTHYRTLHKGLDTESIKVDEYGH